MADSTAWVALGSALAGVAAGGFASAAGSLVVARGKAAFDARTVLYVELVADFGPSRHRDSMHSPGPFPRRILETMHWTAVVAGRKHRRLVAALEATYSQFIEQPADDDPLWGQKPRPTRGVTSEDCAATA